MIVTIRTMAFLFLLLIFMHSANTRNIPWTKLVPPTYNSPPHLMNGQIYLLWRQFLTLFNFTPNNSSYGIFISNTQTMLEHNLRFKKNYTLFDMGINAFAAMTHADYKLRLGFDIQMLSDSAIPRYRYSSSSVVKPPPILDLRKRGFVTPVKDQGSCGSCWAFSAAGALEGQIMHSHGKLFNLSVQQLIDCSSDFSNAGCGGGVMDNAFEYVKAAGGIETEEDYPYISGASGTSVYKCYFNRSRTVASVKGHVDIESGNEEQLREALFTQGPLSIAINAGRRSFMLYKSGIYDDPKCDGAMESLDHGVLLVGYGEERGVKYWLVKNSWGDSWGESGYIRIKKQNNMCGVATMPSYPLV